jgi:excisionase family DNA binding protein
MKKAESSLQPAAFSVQDAGMYLGVSADTVRRLVHAGAIPHARIGNSLRIRRIDLDAYLEDQTTTQWQPMERRRVQAAGV